MTCEILYEGQSHRISSKWDDDGRLLIEHPSAGWIDVNDCEHVIREFEDSDGNLLNGQSAKAIDAYLL